MKNTRPIIGITMGDPFGIGPEIAVKALANEAGRPAQRAGQDQAPLRGAAPDLPKGMAKPKARSPHSRGQACPCGSRGRVYLLCRPLLIGDANVFKQAVTFTGLELKVRSVHSETEADFEPGQIDVLQPAGCCVKELRYGTVSAQAGHAAFTAIEKVINLALGGRIHAVVTGPINKEAIHLAGHNFPGHTEIFAHYTGTSDYAMLLIYGDLRVVHVTTHIPIQQVSQMITKTRVLKVIELAHDACQKLGTTHPRIGVAGLNPHASDGGLFGREEQEHIAPAIEAARSIGINAEGPIPPDTLFPKAIGGWFDICVAMYHDQGHIPLKVKGFIWDQENKRLSTVNGVNITLGLPIIRTSVDHGTAFDIAGKGIASPDSMISAIKYAAKLAKSGETKK